jgi:hypothetical protein
MGACRLNLSRGPGQHESNTAQQDEHDDDPPCDLDGEASTRSARGPRRRRELERGHRAGGPDPRGPILVCICISHEKP